MEAAVFGHQILRQSGKLCGALILFLRRSEIPPPSQFRALFDDPRQKNYAYLCIEELAARGILHWQALFIILTERNPEVLVKTLERTWSATETRLSEVGAGSEEIDSLLRALFLIFASKNLDRSTLCALEKIMHYDLSTVFSFPAIQERLDEHFAERFA